VPRICFNGRLPGEGIVDLGKHPTDRSAVWAKPRGDLRDLLVGDPAAAHAGAVRLESDPSSDFVGENRLTADREVDVLLDPHSPGL
jgi:hypothetical protein